MHTRDKNSSLIQTFVNYGRKSFFITLAPDLLEMTVSDNHASWHRRSVNAPFNQMKVPKIFGLNSVSAKRQFGQVVFGQETRNCRKAEVWSVSLFVGQRSMMSKVVSSIPRRGLFLIRA
jgi:hypothetical protein